MASFGQTFALARKAGKSTFNWNGKSYNTKLSSSSSPSKPKASKASLPDTGPIPTPRSSVATGKRSPFSPTQDRGASGVAAIQKAPQGGPSKRGGGPKIAKSSKISAPDVSVAGPRTPAQRDIAKSKAYIANAGSAGPALDKMKGKKPAATGGTSFRDAMKKVSNSIKMGG